MDVYFDLNVSKKQHYVFILLFFGPLNVRAKIPIHCSLAIKNLRTESLHFVFSKKNKFVFSYTFYKYSILFFSIHVVCEKIYFDFELL